MYLQHFGLEHPPFTRQPNPDVFFTQAGRKNILKALRHDLQQKNAAILLTGPQGSGKTILCRLIRHRLSGSSYKVIFLNNPVGSFETLVWQICEQLNMPATDAAQNITATLQTLLQEQKNQGRRVLLLIDEADKMFLAALERLFRLLNEVKTTYGMKVFLAGHPSLHASIEQLSGYCEGIKIGSTYELPSLSQEETAAYLAYRLRTAQRTTKKNTSVFSQKAVEEIAHLGTGIPGIIDGIAEASMKKAAASKADTVQLNHVTLPENPQTGPVSPEEGKDKKSSKSLLLFLLLLLLVFFFFVRPSFFSRQQKTNPDLPHTPVTLSPENTELEIAVSTVPEEKETTLPFSIEEYSETKEEATASSLSQKEENNSLLSLPIPQRPDFKKKDEEKQEIKEELPQEDLTDELEPGSKATEEASGEKIPVISPKEPEELKHVVQESSSSDNASGTLTTAKKLPILQPASFIELTPGMRKTRPPGYKKRLKSPPSEVKSNRTNTAPPEQKTLVPVGSAQGVTPPAFPTTPLPSALPPSAGEKAASPQKKALQLPEIKISPKPYTAVTNTADQLFARYLGAGRRWTMKEYGDKFTVQLLVLSSNDGVNNIKEIIVRDEYQNYKRKLHILRRETLPPTLFVCYGVYASLEEAQKAKNAMPLFLHKHHPYALSIADVLEKTRD
jgi:type II secretory pathway predicted ATPase ExeA/septal ring-binding cell division protein DamX